MSPELLLELEAACGRAGIRFEPCFDAWRAILETTDGFYGVLDIDLDDPHNAEVIRLLQDRIEREGYVLNIQRLTFPTSSDCLVRAWPLGTLEAEAISDMRPGPQRELWATCTVFCKVFEAKDE